MPRRVLTLLLVVCTALPLLAQKVGDTARQVQIAIGNPQMQRTTEAGDVWIYPGGIRITLQNGVVSDIEGNLRTVPAAKPKSAPETYVTTAAPPPPPKPVQSRSFARPAPPPRPVAPQLELDPAVGRTLKLSLAVLVIGGLVALVSNIMVLVAAFKTSIGWGLGSLFVPFVSLVFVVTHWEETKKPFLVSLAASVAVAITASSAVSSLLAQVPH